MAGPPKEVVPGRARLGLAAAADRADWDAQTKALRRQTDALDAANSQIAILKKKVDVLSNAATAPATAILYPYLIVPIVGVYDFQVTDHEEHSKTMVRTWGFNQASIVILEASTDGGDYTAEYYNTGSSTWVDLGTSAISLTTTGNVLSPDATAVLPQQSAWVNLAAAAIGANIAVRVRTTPVSTTTTDPVNVTIQFKGDPITVLTG